MNPKPFQRRIAIVLLAIFLPSLFPVNLLYASNNGPKAPESANFEPVDTTDMVNLATGDMNYVLPLLNVPSPEGGYPLVLSYHGGIAYDLESSWVGLGWNLNPGAIERGVNGYPDDWKEALIRTRNYYNYNSTALDVGVSVGLGDGSASIDMGVTYGWDSNGGKYGTVNLGAGVGVGENNQNSIGGSVSYGYHNKNGFLFNVGAGYQDKSGFGVGGSVGTSGAGIGSNYSMSLSKNDQGKPTSSAALGISLSSNGIGASYSMSAGAGSSSFSINSGSLGELTSVNTSFAFPIPGTPVWIKAGVRKVKFEKNETYANFVYGPLYYKDFNYQQGQGGSYSTSLSNESNRDLFMDSYEQKLPESETEFVSYKDIYEKQKYAFTFPSYDSYIVNAQGLSGAMTPRLFESGTIVGKSQNFEQKDVLRGTGVVMPAGILFPAVSGYNGGIFHTGFPTEYENRALESFVMNWNYNNTERKFTKSFGNTLNQNAVNELRFYFENSFPSNLLITPSTLSIGNANLLSYIGNTNATITNRQQNGNYVEVFTNKQLAKRASNPSQIITSTTEMYSQTGVLVPYNGDQSYNRIAESGYSDDGIGAYKITTPDGKTYHYAMPVYQYEEVYRQLKRNPDNNSFFSENESYHEQRKNQPYATHWLLTAVTGPDYYDSNNNGMADDQDYGYWTRFDYGKWTDGYCWRAPFNGFNDMDQLANYNGIENAREYGWGRKQLAYLNKVVTRTHTAIMVKSLRHDSMSKEIGAGGYPSFEGDNNVYYPYQRTMKLDEIILVQNENDNVTSANQVEPITSNPSQTRTVYWNSPIVKNYNNANNFVQYKINQQNLVIDKGDLPKDANGNYLLYQKAEKIIKLNQDYSLATNTPHSDAPAVGGVASKGRLTLKSIQNLGRGAYDYMPPTTFDYFNNNLAYQECPNATCNIKNPWGYNNNTPQAWSLQKITTPTGAKLEFELEKDTYWTEAFSRRYWTEDLMFKVTYNSTHAFIDVQNKTGTSVPVQNFSQYFMPGERVYLDLWLTAIFDQNNPWPIDDKHDVGKVDVNSTDFCVVDYVTSDAVRIIVSRKPHTIGNNDPNRINNTWFARGNNPTIGSHVFKSGYRGSFEHNPGGPAGGASRNHNMYFNLLANRTPGEGTGGGLRVKAITSIDEVNNRYTTEYDYNHPTKNRTTGITSFAPVRGFKYVPYQTELPSPRVMYEYVTVREKTLNNGNTKFNGKTVYRFNVLENATNIFDPNITVGNFFKSEVVTNDNLNPTFKVKGAQIKLHDNTPQLGSILSIERFNDANQLLSKSFVKKKSLDELITSTSNNNSKGAIQESFQSMKSIHQFNSNYVRADAGANAIFVNYTKTQKVYIAPSLITHNRFLNISTKTIYTPYTDYTEQIDASGKKEKTWQEDQDPVNGLFNTTITTKSDGKLIKSQIVPAYSVKKSDGTLAYSTMGSKVANSNNKNMLTQEAMTISSVKIGNTWKTTGASITTWNDTWAYRNETTGSDATESSKKVWRKHKTFAWKENLETDGTYSTNITKDNTQFNWGLGTPLSDKWQKLSEITRYTRWSSPLETKDINGNFASTKMADNDTKVLVSGNARYTEMYYSGAEYVKTGNLFDGEVKGANFRTSEVAHTGKYAVKAQNISDKVFEVTGTSGANDYYSNTDNYNATFRPGKYKVSFWAYKISSSSLPRLASNYSVYASLKVNGVSVPYESVESAGCWQLQNYVIDVLPNTNYSIAVSAPYITGENFYDDFRMCPIASNINSYVYESNTDELSFILDANNLGSAFKYDNAGRLVANYSEIIDTPSQTGGFKITSQFKQRYKGTTDVLPNATPTIDNCLNSVVLLPMTANISTECWASFENKYKTNVTGGSGNFSYEYKWVVDYDNNTYSNYVAGTNTMAIPYVPIFCSASTYNRSWKFKVRVTDNVTGQVIEVPYQFNSNSCNNTYNYPNDFAFLQVTKCFDQCGSGDYSFKVHLKNIGLNDNFKYEYATYQPYNPSLGNTFETQTLLWNDVTSTQGRFCPQYSLISAVNCPSGEFRKIYYIAFRITNLNTGEVSIHYPYNVVGDCENGARGSIIQNEHESKILNMYLEEGNIIKRDNKGIYVKEVENINDKMK
jgi:hypothetical protein